VFVLIDRGVKLKSPASVTPN